MNIPGRRYIRTQALCHGCEARRMVGEPRSNDLWPQRLTLTEQQRADLLAAAAEYRDLCEEESIVETAVEFLDWVFVDASRQKQGAAA
jgi:hypothetical protein